MTVSHFARTAEQDAQLGLAPENQPDEEPALNTLDGMRDENQPEEEPLVNTLDGMRDEVLQFYTNCPDCNAPASTNMKLVQIPHFKEVIIMATNCEKCGHRTNEVKSGGATEPLGTRITLHVTDASDMCRDVLKSACELDMAVLGGKFTTLEGLLTNIKELVSTNLFTCGDSPTDDHAQKVRLFSEKIEQIIVGKMDVHFVLDDPAGNSYVQNVYAPDPEMTIEKYRRTEEQDQGLGISDMKRATNR